MAEVGCTAIRFSVDGDKGIKGCSLLCGLLMSLPIAPIELSDAMCTRSSVTLHVKVRQRTQNEEHGLWTMSLDLQYNLCSEIILQVEPPRLIC